MICCTFQEFALKPDTRAFRMWEKPPVTLNTDIYLYNWTNPTNFAEDDYEKPILKQIGSYRFREVGVKTKVNWHPKNSAISYRKRTTYLFDAEGSVGRLDDKITTINAVAIVSSFGNAFTLFQFVLIVVNRSVFQAAANTARDRGFIFQKKVPMALKLYNQPVFIKCKRITV